MKKRITFLLASILIFITSASRAAIYNCRMTSPKASLFFERQVKIECDLDSEAKPKFVVLSGSSKVALNQKAQYLGPETNKMYELHQMTALDGQIFDIHTAARMFTETLQASFFTVEPKGNSAFWICNMED